MIRFVILYLMGEHHKILIILKESFCDIFMWYILYAWYIIMHIHHFCNENHWYDYININIRIRDIDVNKQAYNLLIKNLIKNYSRLLTLHRLCGSAAWHCSIILNCILELGVCGRSLSICSMSMQKTTIVRGLCDSLIVRRWSVFVKSSCASNVRRKRVHACVKTECVKNSPSAQRMVNTVVVALGKWCDDFSCEELLLIHGIVSLSIVMDDSWYRRCSVSKISKERRRLENSSERKEQEGLRHVGDDVTNSVSNDFFRARRRLSPTKMMNREDSLLLNIR